MTHQFEQELKQVAHTSNGVLSQPVIDHYVALGRRLHAQAVRRIFTAAGYVLAQG